MSDLLSNDFRLLRFGLSADGSPDSSGPFGPRRPPALADAARRVENGPRDGRQGPIASWLWPFPEATWTVMESRISSSVRGWPRPERATTRCRWMHFQAARASGSGRQRFRRRWRAECRAGHRRNRCPRLQSWRLARCIPDVRPVFGFWAGAGPPVDPQCRLARVSGRDGHVVWDVLLADYQGARTGPLASSTRSRTLTVAAIVKSSCCSARKPMSARARLSCGSCRSRTARPAGFMRSIRMRWRRRLSPSAMSMGMDAWTLS